MRKCHICKNEMVEGHVHEELGLYFCSDEHLDQQWEGTSAELNAMTQEEFDESVIYWTDWHDEEEEEEN